ncbi:MAG: four helix bundle protein [archaeon]
MTDVKKLLIYQLAKEIEIDIRTLLKKFPRIEEYCLTKQLKTSANSVGANIAEGAGRSTKADFLRFLFNSNGSLKEVLHHIEIARSEQYITEQEYVSANIKINELGRMLNAFISNLKSVPLRS